jgi:hypothetical protein
MLGTAALGQLTLGEFSSSFGKLPGAANITDTTKLKLPINCVLADQQDYEIGHSVIEENAPNIRTKVTLSRSAVQRLSDSEPSFTTISNKKGYD